MSFGMFSGSFLDPFDRSYGFGSFNPWAIRQRPAYYSPRCAPRDGFGSWNTPFWDTPTYMEDQCEYPERQSSARRGRKTRPKSAQGNSRKFHRPRCCVHDSEPEDSEKQVTQDSESKVPKKRNAQVTPPPERELSDLCVNDPSEEEERQRCDPLQTSSDQEMTKSEEENLRNNEFPQESEEEDEDVEGAETVDTDVVNEDDKNEEEDEQSVDSSQPEVQEPENSVPEQNAPEEKCDDDSTMDDNEEQKEEKENPEDTEKKKLKFIEQQLTKAREIAPKEVLAKPIEDDKQRLYLTEMLLRCILDLDTIQAEGNETVKSARKNTVREIQSYLDHVEKKS